MGMKLSSLKGPTLARCLLDSAAQGDEARVRQILQLKPKLAAYSQLIRQETCLHVAAARGHLKVLEAILSAIQPGGVHSSSRHPSGPQVCAVTATTTSDTGHPASTAPHQQTEALPCVDREGLRLDKLVNRANRQGVTALMLAAAAGYNSCVAYLLSHGADPMLQDNLKRSALHHAVGSGKVQVVRQLLQDSTRVNTATGPQILRDFLQQDHAAGRVRYIDQRAKFGMAPLQIAVLREDVACVQVLLEAGADLMVQTVGDGEPLPQGRELPPLGSNPLHLAVIRRNIGIMQMLLQANLDRMGTWGGGQEERQSWEGDARLDLRCRRNAKGQLPWHLAARRPEDLAVLVNPARPITLLLDDIQSKLGALGPAKLHVLAARAVRAALLSWMLAFQVDLAEAAAKRAEASQESKGASRGLARMSVPKARVSFQPASDGPGRSLPRSSSRAASNLSPAGSRQAQPRRVQGARSLHDPQRCQQRLIPMHQAASSLRWPDAPSRLQAQRCQQRLIPMHRAESSVEASKRVCQTSSVHGPACA